MQDRACVSVYERLVMRAQSRRSVWAWSSHALDVDIYDHFCTACPLHVRASSVCVPARGTSQYRAMVVGEAPGREEDRRNIPFIGPAGKILDRALDEAFITEFGHKEIIVTNAVKCRPPGNRNPTQEEIATCVDLYLTKEVEEIDPVAILCLGNIALDALLDLTGISSARGQWFPLERESGHETEVMPTWHPAYVGYRGGVGSTAWDEFLSDVEAFATRVIAKS